MKKLFILTLLFVCSITGTAQTLDGTLLPDVLAADAKTKLFCEALQLTGLDETLRNYIYADYQAPGEKYYPYPERINDEYNPSPCYWYNTNRYKKFTMFVETDDVLTAQGITNIDQLKAYAKRVYDGVYPDDASVIDPKDPRNSLYRFVAYHILPFGCSYWYLTYYDGKNTDKCIVTNVTDIAVWYGTLMSNASLKCSYPMGSEKGVFVNRRGLKDGPDKDGKQVRGAKVVPGDSNDSDPFTHIAYNGYYFYIDDILAYDKITQKDVLGSEQWRVDFKALSPDIMNNSEELRGNWYEWNSQDVKDGRNFAYDWNSLENITAENMNGIFTARRAVSLYDLYLCDEVGVFGDGGSITIKLPPLPPGEWEVRMGTTSQNMRPKLRVYLNDQVTIESLDLTLNYYGTDMDFSKLPGEIKYGILDYMAKNVFVVTQQDEGLFLVTDVKTGEQILLTRDPYGYYEWSDGTYIYRGFFQSDRISGFVGTDPLTGAELDWNERAKIYRGQVTNDYISTLPKVMRAPEECRYNVGGTGMWSSISTVEINVRYPLGQIKTDGKTDNYVKLEYLSDESQGNNYELAIDYFEFVPLHTYDDDIADIEPVEENGEVSFDSEDGLDENTDLDGNVIDNIYYSIDNNDGAYSSEEGCIVLTTSTSDEEITNLEGEDIFSENFNNTFTGLVFMLSAGYGTIKVNAESVGNMALKVKVGDDAPMSFKLDGKMKVSIPYNVSEPTYIYIYGGEASFNARSVRKTEEDALKIYGIEWEQTGINGDVNGDGKVDVNDITEIVKYIMNPWDGFNIDAADANDDGVVNIVDIVVIMNKVIGN